MGFLGGASTGGGGGSVTRFNSRPGPVILPEDADYTAEQIVADGPLGATRVQSALDALLTGTTFNGRAGPTILPADGDYTGSEIVADGPLGATRIQEAVDLLAAAGPYYTVEQTAAFVLGTPPTYTTIKTFTISTGTTRHLDAKIYLAGGTATAPTAAMITVSANARRTSGGTITVPSTSPLIVQLGFTALSISWAVSGANVVLQLRANGGPTVRAVLIYNWTQVLPP